MLALLMKCCSDPGSGPQALRRAKQASVVVIDATGMGIWVIQSCSRVVLQVY